MLRSNLCDYSDAYILVKGTTMVTVLGANNGANNIRDKKNRPLILKNNAAPFVSCITRIKGELMMIGQGTPPDLGWGHLKVWLSQSEVGVGWAHPIPDSATP